MEEVERLRFYTFAYVEVTRRRFGTTVWKI